MKEGRGGRGKKYREKIQKRLLGIFAFLSISRQPHASEKRSFTNEFNKACLNTCSVPGHRPSSGAQAESDLYLPAAHSTNNKPSRGSEPFCPRRKRGYLSRVLRNYEECMRVASHRETNVLKGTETKQFVRRMTHRSMSPEH